MSDWTLEKEKDFDRTGDYVVRDENGTAIIIDTAYYPAAPCIEDAELIVKAVNFYRSFLQSVSVQTQDQSEGGEQ